MDRGMASRDFHRVSTDVRAWLGGVVGSGDGYAAWTRRNALRRWGLVALVLLAFVAIAIGGYAIGASQAGTSIRPDRRERMRVSSAGPRSAPARVREGVPVRPPAGVRTRVPRRLQGGLPRRVRSRRSRGTRSRTGERTVNLRNASNAIEPRRRRFWRLSPDPRLRIGILVSLLAVVVGVTAYVIARYEGVDPSQDQNLQHQAYRASFEVAHADAAAQARQAGRRAGERAGEKAGQHAGANAGERRGAAAVKSERWRRSPREQAIEAAQARAATRRGSRQHQPTQPTAPTPTVTAPPAEPAPAPAPAPAGHRHPRRKRPASTRPATPAERHRSPGLVPVGEREAHALRLDAEPIGEMGAKLYLASPLKPVAGEAAGELARERAVGAAAAIGVNRLDHPLGEAHVAGAQ